MGRGKQNLQIFKHSVTAHIQVKGDTKRILWNLLGTHIQPLRPAAARHPTRRRSEAVSEAIAACNKYAPTSGELRAALERSKKHGGRRDVPYMREQLEPLHNFVRIIRFDTLTIFFTGAHQNTRMRDGVGSPGSKYGKEEGESELDELGFEVHGSGRLQRGSQDMLVQMVPYERNLYWVERGLHGPRANGSSGWGR